MKPYEITSTLNQLFYQNTIILHSSTHSNLFSFFQCADAVFSLPTVFLLKYYLYLYHMETIKNVNLPPVVRTSSKQILL